jgi:hypothetical protein
MLQVVAQATKKPSTTQASGSGLPFSLGVALFMAQLRAHP